MTETERHRALNLLRAYMLVALCYYVFFAPVLIFYSHKMWLGIAHAIYALVVGGLLSLLMHTKNTRHASLGLCMLVASTVFVLAIDGGVNGSGAFFVFPATVFLFFLPNRRCSMTWIGIMFVSFLWALALAFAGVVTLPYNKLNFALFIASFVFLIALLVMYAREKDKLDRKLNQSLREIRLLARSLEQEKEHVEEKVQLRTQQYRKEHAKLEASINSLRIGIIILDHSLTVLSVNDAAERILFSGASTHKPPSPVSTMPMSTIIELLGGAYDLTAKVHACFKHKKPIIARDIQLGNLYVAITITPVIDGQTCVGAVVLLEDTSDAKALERSRDEFFSIASHELRTPLTSIVGNSFMAQEYYDRLNKNELQGMLGDINTSGKRLITIVNDFLDVSRLEQGRISVKLESVQVDTLVRDLVKELSGIAKEHGLTLLLTDLPSSHVIAHADHDRTKQILINIIGNAIKYTEKGKITIGIRIDGSAAIISVTDTGKGIPADSQYLLFRKFQQASNNTLTRDNSQSTGLGLYISQKLAKAMKGDLYLEQSNPDEGSTFALRLPLER